MISIVHSIRFGPFATDYHQSLVNEEFKTKLGLFLDREILPQMDAPLVSAEGKLVATYNHDRHCGPNSLVRNIFSLDLVLVADDGVSKLKTDIAFDPLSKIFCGRSGRQASPFLWTPARKLKRDQQEASINNFISETKRGNTGALTCPICNGTVLGTNNENIGELRCADRSCFKYDYTQNRDGKIIHSRFRLL